jgi:hypothetical protein
MKKFIFSILFLLIIRACFSQTVYSDSGSYLGQVPPGSTPKIFAPGIISLSNRLETYPTFSPDGKDMFFSVVNSNWTKGAIFHTQERNGSWSVPDTAIFSKNNYINWESFIAPDGRRQFFASTRPPSVYEDIWMIERTSDTTWTSPVRLNSPVNSNSTDGSACVTNNGTLYFKSLRGGGIAMLYRARPIDSAYSQVENIGNIVHTIPGDTEPFMAPDESYLIFTSSDTIARPGWHGGWDLWICFRKSDSSWTVPINMGPNINTTNDEYSPRVTQDGKYLFFTRENRGNTMDIYWVSANIIDSLKSTVISVNQLQEQVPDRYKLFQNYPNPFNPSTVIGYSILNNSYVNIKLYNVLGKEITTLVDSFQKRGMYDVTLNMNDLNLASGIYFYTLKTNEINSDKSYVETKIMNYIK